MDTTFIESILDMISTRLYFECFGDMYSSTRFLSADRICYHCKEPINGKTFQSIKPGRIHSVCAEDYKEWLHADNRIKIDLYRRDKLVKKVDKLVIKTLHSISDENQSVKTMFEIAKCLFNHQLDSTDNDTLPDVAFISKIQELFEFWLDKEEIVNSSRMAYFYHVVICQILYRSYQVLGNKTLKQVHPVDQIHHNETVLPVAIDILKQKILLLYHDIHHFKTILYSYQIEPFITTFDGFEIEE